MADLVLVQTEAEAKDIETDFSCSGAPLKSLPLDKVVVVGSSRFRWERVVNGADARFAEADAGWFARWYNLSGFVLCVGRIEPRKNQLAVAAAAVKLKSQKPISGGGSGCKA